MKIFTHIFLMFITLPLFSQEDSLITIYEFNAPCPSPWGLTYHDNNLWVSDDSLGRIYQIMTGGEIFHEIHVPNCRTRGFTFVEDTLWVVNGKSVGDTLLFNPWDSSYYKQYFYQIYKVDKYNGAKLDSIRMMCNRTIMLGIAYYDSKLYVSYHGGWGPCMFEINPREKKVIQELCCAHPSGLETIDDTLWSVRSGGKLIIPIEFTENSVPIELWDFGYRIDFIATDLAHDGANFWLCHQSAGKIKKMAQKPSKTRVFNNSESSVFPFKLFPNYPNPFNSGTKIQFQLPHSSCVTIKIYNSMGQCVRVLSENQSVVGENSMYWDGKNHRGEDVSSGMYFYNMATDQFLSTNKMILMR